MSAVLPIDARSVLHIWRQHIGQKNRYALQRGPRPFAIVGYRIPEKRCIRPLVALHRLTIVSVFDELLEDGHIATRVIDVGAAIEDGHLRFGGPRLSRFDKDLRLPPTREGRGKRFSTLSVDFLSYALRLERFLERCSRHPGVPRRRAPLLPVLPPNLAHGGFYYVDLRTLPKRQVVRLESPERNLCGQCGTTQFDLLHTRFQAESKVA